MQTARKMIFGIIIVLLVSSLFAQKQDVYQKSPFTEIVKNARASVVNIKAEGEQKLTLENQLPFNDDFFKYFFPPMPDSRKYTSMGSGFIFKKDKNDIYILTNNHVIGKSKDVKITITLADQEKLQAKVVGLDPETDLAVIKAEVPDKTPITVVPLGDSDKLDIAEWVVAIGNPFGQLGLDRTVTVGVVSAIGRSGLNFGNESPLFQDYIQTDAAINPGNSGGPLLNIKGEVIGVNAAITSTSGGNIGIGFAIPVNLAKKVAEDLISNGKVQRGYFGITPQDITAEISKTLNLDEIAGVLVAQVEKNTPAFDSGIKNGDVIVKFNDQKVQNAGKFRIIVANSPIGKKVPLELIRDGKALKMDVVLKSRGSDEEKKDDKTEVKSIDLGIRVDELNSDIARRMNIQAENGVLITQVKNNSVAAEANLRPGDVIVEINKQKIMSVKDYQDAIKNAEKEKTKILLLYVQTANGMMQYVPVSVE